MTVRQAKAIRPTLMKPTAAHEICQHCEYAPRGCLSSEQQEEYAPARMVHPQPMVCISLFIMDGYMTPPRELHEDVRQLLCAVSTVRGDIRSGRKDAKREHALLLEVVGYGRAGRQERQARGELREHVCVRKSILRDRSTKRRSHRMRGLARGTPANRSWRTTSRISCVMNFSQS